MAKASVLQKKPAAPKNVKYALSVPQSVLFAELSLLGNKRDVFKRVIDLDFETSYIAIDTDGAMSWNYDSDDSFEAVFVKGDIRKALDGYIKSMQKTSTKLYKTGGEFKANDLDGLDQTKMIAELKDYWKNYINLINSLFIYWNIEKLLVVELTDQLKAAGLFTEPADLDRFIVPAATNQFIRERRSFNRIVNKYKKSGSITAETADNALKDALEQHSREFGFLLIPFNLGDGPDLGALVDRFNETEATAEELQRKVDSFDDLPENIQELGRLSKEMAYWKNERIDALSYADAMMSGLYKKASKVLKISTGRLFLMTSSEILSSLKTGAVIVEESVLDSRERAFCLVLANGKIDFYEPSIHEQQDIVDSSQQTTGRVASKGTVTGKVRLVMNLDDAKELEKGEVLVTAMTRPEMGVALDRAAAFITDQGGVLCHAAIIAREMNKPCVIATNNATKIFKTGDIIKVDAENGVVSKLN